MQFQKINTVWEYYCGGSNVGTVAVKKRPRTDMAAIIDLSPCIRGTPRKEWVWEFWGWLAVLPHAHMAPLISCTISPRVVTFDAFLFFLPICNLHVRSCDGGPQVMAKPRGPQLSLTPSFQDEWEQLHEEATKKKLVVLETKFKRLRIYLGWNNHTWILNN